MEENHESDLLVGELITQAQIQAWHEYEKVHSDELVQQIESAWESLTPYKKKEMLKMMKKGR
ncbi:MAG: hypothetical protein ACLQVJ_01400 [Syntrophobacteraceae bacterium]